MSTTAFQTGLTCNFRPGRLIVAVTLVGVLTLPVCAQPLPREDVVDAPAIGEELWNMSSSLNLEIEERVQKRPEHI